MNHPTLHLVAKLLSVSPKRLRAWVNDGVFYVNDAAHIDVDWLDAWLSTAAISFATPPNWEDLKTRRLVLLKPAKVRALLGAEEHVLLRLLHRGQLAGFKLRPAVIRYSRNSVTALSPQPTYVFGRAAHILGLAEHTLYRMGLKGTLQIQKSPIDSRVRLVSVGQVRVLLRDMLPEWIDVDTWIQDRESTTEKLVTLRAATARLGVSYDTLKRLLDEQWIEYRVSPGGEPALSPTSLRDYEISEELLTVEQVGRIFGVAVRVVSEWRLEGWMTCPLHDHPDGGLWLACVTAIIQPWLSPGLSAVSWVGYRGQLPMNTQRAAAFLGISPRGVSKLARKGVLKGLHHPSGNWVFRYGQIQKYKASRRDA